MGKKFYSELTLAGAKATAAIDCMKKDGIFPSDVTFGPERGLVQADSDGSVRVNLNLPENHSVVPNPEQLIVEKGNDLANFSNGTARAIELNVSGPPAEQMRQKARACAFKAVGLKPD